MATHPGQAEHPLELLRLTLPAGGDQLGTGGGDQVAHGPGDDQGVVEVSDDGDEVGYEVDGADEVEEGEAGDQLRPAGHGRLSYQVPEEGQTQRGQPGQLHQGGPAATDAEGDGSKGQGDGPGGDEGPPPGAH